MMLRPFLSLEKWLLSDSYIVAVFIGLRPLVQNYALSVQGFSIIIKKAKKRQKKPEENPRFLLLIFTLFWFANNAQRSFPLQSATAILSRIILWDLLKKYPGGTGTSSRYDEARSAGIKIFDFRQGGLVVAANELFTIGYEAYSQESFLEALQTHQITALADVRARPYSSFKPEFSQEPLKHFLQKDDIAYVPLGEQCGVSIYNREKDSPTRIMFQAIVESTNFKKGLERIKNGLQRHHIVLMCAEKDPLNCHRFLLICRHIPAGIRIKHILEAGSIEENEETIARLLQVSELDQPALFRSREELLDLAYINQEEKILDYV